MESRPRTRVRGISAKTLSLRGYAVCLFPEQPRRQVIQEQDRATEEEFHKSVVQKVEAAAKARPPDLIRLHWRNRLVYVIAFVAFSLSLNNVYHFPLNVYRYGTNFFIPYTIITIVIGFPLHVLQTSLGQYSQRGPLWVWECAPLFFGVGIAMIVACAIMSLYYNIFAAYSFVYFAHCFHRVLPWIYCSDISWSEKTTCAPAWWYSSPNITLPSRDYFYSIILNTQHRYPPEGWSLGSLKWWLVLSLLFSWFVVYVATLRSVRSLGKIAIVIVIFSYFAILMLVFVALQLKKSEKLRSGLLDGVENGGVFNPEMWSVATMQVLLELGLCHGIPVAYGSFCHYRNVLYVDSIILCVINYANSMIFFYLFFAYVSTLSCDVDNLPWKLADSTVAIVYIIYSEAFARLSGSNLWCMVFFFMLFLIVIGTQIAVTETIMTAIYDNFYSLSEFRWIINLIICGGFFLFGLIFCFSQGFYGGLILHYIPIWFTIVPLVCLSAIGVILVYGLSRYSENMKLMLDYNVNLFIKFLLYFIVVMLVVIVVIMAVSMHSITFVDSGLDYHKDNVSVAWVVSAIILAPIVLCLLLWGIFCFLARGNICGPTETWRDLQDERQQEFGQFAKTYSSSYTWNWNKEH